MTQSEHCKNSKNGLGRIGLEWHEGKWWKTSLCWSVGHRHAIHQRLLSHFIFMLFSLRVWLFTWGNNGTKAGLNQEELRDLWYPTGPALHFKQWDSSIPSALDGLWAGSTESACIVPPPALLGQTKPLIKGIACAHRGQTSSNDNLTAHQIQKSLDRVITGERKMALSSGRWFDLNNLFYVCVAFVLIFDIVLYIHSILRFFTVHVWFSLQYINMMCNALFFIHNH